MMTIAISPNFRTLAAAAILLAAAGTYPSASKELEAASLAESLAQDSECGASGSEEPSSSAVCALSALQRAAALGRVDVAQAEQMPEKRKDRVDLESEEGASLIEAAREWYAAHTGEQGSEERGLNLTDGMLATEPKDGIAPPTHAAQYNGISWPTLNLTSGSGEVHFFAIGDWGGLDGALECPDGFPRMITYPGGHLPGPHVFPRSRLSCSHDHLNNCYFGGEKWCPYSCGFAKGVDDKAQLLVAEQVKKRAKVHDPKLILNVGDNFYWGGIAKKCGYPMNQIHTATKHQFDTIFEEIYRGPGLDGKPWLSVLGNHDWGGRMFEAGWDQQIAYTWASDRWLMPGMYWHQNVALPGYTVDVYMVDTNFHDAKAPYKDVNHNICGVGEGSNSKTSSCTVAGGPPDPDACEGWFERLWKEEKSWLDRKMDESVADWQIVVTHFPCDHTPRYWRWLHETKGLDLLVTGHRHDQELWKANQWGHRGMLGGLTCIVTGGGGGITSEESPLWGRPSHHWPNVDTQYGFFDFTVTKEVIKVESIDYKGKVVDSTQVEPKIISGNDAADADH